MRVHIKISSPKTVVEGVKVMLITDGQIIAIAPDSWVIECEYLVRCGYLLGLALLS